MSRPPIVDIHDVFGVAGPDLIWRRPVALVLVGVAIWPMQEIPRVLRAWLTDGEVRALLIELLSPWLLMRSVLYELFLVGAATLVLWKIRKVWIALPAAVLVNLVGGRLLLLHLTSRHYAWIRGHSGFELEFDWGFAVSAPTLASVVLVTLALYAGFACVSAFRSWHVGLVLGLTAARVAGPALSAFALLLFGGTAPGLSDVFKHCLAQLGPGLAYAVLVVLALHVLGPAGRPAGRFETQHNEEIP